MADLEHKEPTEYVKETIKVKPVNKRKLLRRTLITASMALLFGLIACFTFLVLEPVISNFLYPEEEPQVVVFPEDQEEMSPEEMLADSMQQELQNQQNNPPIIITPPENSGLDVEQLQKIIENVTLDLENIQNRTISVIEEDLVITAPNSNPSKISVLLLSISPSK